LVVFVFFFIQVDSMHCLTAPETAEMTGPTLFLNAAPRSARLDLRSQTPTAPIEPAVWFFGTLCDRADSRDLGFRVGRVGNAFRTAS
jgi:hypothetical protein